MQDTIAAGVNTEWLFYLLAKISALVITTFVIAANLKHMKERIPAPE